MRAATILADIGPAATPAEAGENIILTTKLVAAELGNTPAITRESYIHPTLLEQYEEHGRTIEGLMPDDARRARNVRMEEPVELHPEEARPSTTSTSTQTSTRRRQTT
ncbi:hypothetical protein BH23GEM3_BH23GEM3_22230 [soil metagenome]